MQHHEGWLCSMQTQSGVYVAAQLLLYGFQVLEVQAFRAMLYLQ